MMLDERELNDLRATARQVLPDRAVLLHAVRSDDGQGGQTLAYAAAGTVDARLAPEAQLRRGEPIVSGSISEVSAWILTLPHDTVMPLDARVIYDNVQYEVTEVLHWDPWEISRRVRLVKVAVEPSTVETLFFGERTNIYAPESFWNIPLPDNVLLQSGSTATAANSELVRQSLAFIPILNTITWTAKVHVVPLTTPLVPVTLYDQVRRDESFAGNDLETALAGGVPIPSGVFPTLDGDAHLVLWQPDFVGPNGQKGRLFELWRAVFNNSPSPLIDIPNGITLPIPPFSWGCSYGVRATGTQEIPEDGDASYGHSAYGYPGSSPRNFGLNTPGDPRSSLMWYEWRATGTGLPIIGGIVTREDLMRRSIDHAIGIIVSDYAEHPNILWPAQHTDGFASFGAPEFALVAGMRIRFPVGSEPPALMHPVGKLIHNAIRDYGGVFMDKTAGNGLAIRAEPDCIEFYNGADPGEILNGMPWDRAQLIAVGTDSNPNRLI